MSSHMKKILMSPLNTKPRGGGSDSHSSQALLAMGNLLCVHGMYIGNLNACNLEGVTVLVVSK